MQTQAMAARLSKFKIGDLALRSAMELERARAGVKYDPGRLHELADALRTSAGKADEQGKMSHMRPGFLEPFERVYRARNSGEPKSYEQISEFVAKAIVEIDGAANEQIDDAIATRLVDFCLELNREFVRRQQSEGRVGRSQRGVPVEAFVR
jgi:hypothetical protein